jgi:chromosome segregation ATPase
VKQKIVNVEKMNVVTPKRMRSESERLMAEKDSRILLLTTELDSQKTLFSSERFELESELERMLQLKDSLLNEVSVLRAESDDIQRKLLQERNEVTSSLQTVNQENSKLQQTIKATDETHRKEASDLTGQVKELQSQLDGLSATHKRLDWESTSRLKNLERELEKSKALINTLQETLQERNEEDRRNVTLLQMLNHQLDENKQRSQQLLEEEREKTQRAKKELLSSETTVKQLQEENDLHRREKEAFKRQSESDLQDYKSKLEQMKFDMKYLHTELHSFKALCTKHQQESTQVKASAVAETSNARIEVESVNKKVDELESLIRRKDREHFDKVTFLNAQISNNRTIIAQLQQKLSREREEHAADSSAIATDAQDKALTIQNLHNDLEKKKSCAYENEPKLSSDISILKSTVFQLQAALVEREKQLETTRAAQDEEIRRLRSKLDEHFIPHRSEEGGRTLDEKSVETALSEKVSFLTRELELRNKVALENEQRMKGQVSNQNQIIDSLQEELHRTKSEWRAEVKLMEDEVGRLKKTLDVHFIPYQK